MTIEIENPDNWIDFPEPGEYTARERRQIANERPHCIDCYAFVSKEQAKKSSYLDPFTYEWDGPWCEQGKGCRR